MSPHPAPREYERLDELSEVRRLEVLGHAAACPACRDVLTAHDPTAIFSLLALESVPELSLARLTRDIDAAIEAAPRVSRWRAVAALAASLTLAAFFGYQALQDDPIRSASARFDARFDESLDDNSEMTARPVLPLLPLADRAPERGLELISSPSNADVVHFAVGETQVVMIFDSALDI